LRHRRSHNLRRPPQTPATGSPFHPQRQSASHPAPLPTSSLPSWSASAHTLPDQSAPAEQQPTPCSSSSQPPAVPLGRFADRTCSATWPAASSAPQETQAAVSWLPSAAALPQPASTFCLVPTSHFLPSCLLSDPHIDQPIPADNRGHIRVRRIHHPRCQLRIIVALNPVKVSLDRFLPRLLLQVSKPELGGNLIDGINRCQCPVKRSTVHHHLQSHSIALLSVFVRTALVPQPVQPLPSHGYSPGPKKVPASECVPAPSASHSSYPSWPPEPAQPAASPRPH